LFSYRICLDCYPPFLTRGIPGTPYQLGLPQIRHYVPRIPCFEPITEPEKPPKERNLLAVAIGGLSRLKGCKARAGRLTEEQRKGIAQKAAKSRWGKEKNTV